MSLPRRELLKTSLCASAAAALPHFAWAQTAFAPQPGAWRSFAITTHVQIAEPRGRAQAWIPLPTDNETGWFKSLGSAWTSNGTAGVMREPNYGAELLHVEWPNGGGHAVIEVTSRITTRDRAVDFGKPENVPQLSVVERALYTRGTELIPVDGIVKETSDKIIAGAETDLDKAHAIYEWVVSNTFRDAKVPGCGIGDIAAMLRSGNLGGKCADINALYVGLARAAGMPARDVYGIRVAPSKLGYKSLGANSTTITKAQHCRAEVHLAGFGWIAVDPADVRKVALEEPPARLPLEDPKVITARKTLFGAWETNWLAYNFAHDVALPGSSGPKIPFLMYPQAEVADVRLDCLDADGFKYVITTKELTAA